MTIQQWRLWERRWRQGKGSRIAFGGMDIEGQGVMPDHWQKQNNMKG